MPFIQINFIQLLYKEKSGAITKLTLVQKKRNQQFKKHNKLYFELWYQHCYCYCGDKIRALFKTLAAKKATIWRLNNLRVTIKYYEKQCLPAITQNRKHSSKPVVPTYTLEKRIFAAVIFKDSRVVSFQTKHQKVWYTLIC